MKAFTFNGKGGIGRGQIAADGVVYNLEPFAIPSTGGTKDFAGVGGQVTVRNLSDSASSLMFQIQR